MLIKASFNQGDIEIQDKTKPKIEGIGIAPIISKLSDAATKIDLVINENDKGREYLVSSIYDKYNIGLSKTGSRINITLYGKDNRTVKPFFLSLSGCQANSFSRSSPFYHLYKDTAKPQGARLAKNPKNKFDLYHPKCNIEKSSNSERKRNDGENLSR